MVHRTCDLWNRHILMFGIHHNQLVYAIDGYMKSMAKLGNVDITNKKFANHSIRKTTVCKLQKTGVSNDKIIAFTGHRNEMSLKAYCYVDVDEHKKISSILSDHPNQLQPSSQHHCVFSMEHAPSTASNYPSA